MVVGIALAVLALACLTLWLAAPGFFARIYMRQTRQPTKLARDAVGAFPTEHHLDDVPWIATREWYCQSNSLAMIAAQHGIDEPTGHLCFLTGFTYGASRQPDRWDFMPYTDPEAGFGVAAPYLGLVRRYYVTDDPSLYLDALRYYLSQGHAVRVGLDVAVLYDLLENKEHPHYNYTAIYNAIVEATNQRIPPDGGAPGDEPVWQNPRHSDSLYGNQIWKQSHFHQKRMR